MALLKVEVSRAIFPFVQRATQPAEIALAPAVIAIFMLDTFIKVDQENLTLIVEQDIAGVQVGMLYRISVKAPDNHADSFPGFFGQILVAQNFGERA